MIASLLVAVLATLVTAALDASLWVDALIPSLFVWAACAVAMAWLGWTLIVRPQNVMKIWIAGMIVHFGSVVGGGLAFILLLEYNPVATLLASFATCFVCVFGGAWMAQLPSASPSASGRANHRMDQPLAEANS